MVAYLDRHREALRQLMSTAGPGNVEFPDQPMPPGSQPPTAEVSFVKAAGGFFIVKTQPTVRWNGPDRDVREFLSTGETRFPDAAMAGSWLRRHMVPLYGHARPDTHRSPAVRQNASSLTDINEVQRLRTAARDSVSVSPEWLYDFLSHDVRGQDSALRLLACHVARHAARREPRRPVSAMLVGPTGVGKTKTAERLAAGMNAAVSGGGAFPYLRLDMCEYTEAHRKSQLLGAPQGYVGHGEGAQLVDVLAASGGRCVVLFDEIEKAHPSTFMTIMNMLDAGRLSSPSRTANGTRGVDCRHAIFLFTSNLDSDGILAELEERRAFGDPAAADEVCRRRLHGQGIPPELIGRIACFPVFRPLTEPVKAEIVAMAIGAIGKEYGVEIVRIDPQVIAAILDGTQSRAWGARPYEYAVDTMLGQEFARAAGAGLRGPMTLVAGPPPACIPAQMPSGLSGIARCRRAGKRHDAATGRIT